MRVDTMLGREMLLMVVQDDFVFAQHHSTASFSIQSKIWPYKLSAKQENLRGDLCFAHLFKTTTTTTKGIDTPTGEYVHVAGRLSQRSESISIS